MEYRKRVEETLRKIIIKERNEDNLLVHSLRGPRRIVRVPLILDEKLSFLCGVIIGDGHLRLDKKKISIELTDYNLLFSIKEIFTELFSKELNITKRKTREGHKDSYVLGIDSRAIYDLMNLVFGISSGKKSNYVGIPELIISSDLSIKSAFLAGILVTEGGKRKRGIGLSTSSKRLWEDLLRVFSEMSLKILKDKWVNEKYEKEYYGISFSKETLASIVQNCRDSRIKEIIESRENLKI